MNALPLLRSSGRRLCLCLALLAVFSVAIWSLTTATSAPPESPAGNGLIEVTGRTQAILTRRAAIANVPLHPVTEVLVEPGARVKKDQLLVKLDADEPEADVRAKQAALESAEIALKEARRYQAQADQAYSKGALPEQRYHEVRAAALKAEKDEQAAKAALDAAKAELEHYTLTSPIDGVVSRLEVYPGLVSRPGRTVWGEILDLRELDVRCDVPLEQVDRIAVGQAAEVRKNPKAELFGTGRVNFVGMTVDKNGLVPVIVRLANPEERLRCDEPVHVRFAGNRGKP
jgi:RND family efflux transporter MFP subunit